MWNNKKKPKCGFQYMSFILYIRALVWTSLIQYFKISFFYIVIIFVLRVYINDKC